MTILWLLVAAACTGSSHVLPGISAAPTVAVSRGGVDRPLAADLQRTLDEVQVEQRFPGVAAAVVLPDGDLWTGASGYADIDDRRPVTPHTIFALASMSKAFVSVLAVDLAADGVLALDDRLAEWVPEFPNSENITLLQLLTGTSGITDDNDHPFTAVEDDPSRRWTFKEFLDRVPPPACPPGSCRSGNENAPFVLLGAAIERATGSSLAALYQRRFFRPLGLDEIFLQSEERVRGDIASGYQDDGSGHFEPRQGPPGPLTTSWATSGPPAASMASSAEDVALWVHAVFGGSLIDSKALATITDLPMFSGLAGSYECTPAGVAFGAWSFDGREVRLANGGIPGFGSALSHFPREGLTVVALGNRTPPDGHDPSGIQEVRDALARTALDRLTPPPATTACNVDVYSVGADGSELERLTTDPAADGLPSWSTNGRRMVFGSNRDGDFETYAMNADGSGQADLTNDPGSDEGGSWSPDGTHIAFPSDRDGDHEIYVMKADGSGVRQLTRNTTEDSAPSWSPDGMHIAFTRELEGRFDMYVMNADGSGVRRLTRDADVQWGAAWSPDGTRIAFETGDPRHVYGRQILTMKADGSDVAVLLADPAGDHQPAWGPTGLIAFSSDGDIFAIRPDGTGRNQITDGWPQDLAPSWSPDGSRIAFASERRVAVGSDSSVGQPRIDQVRSELRSYIEDVTQATASRYAAVDDRGHEMDAVKIIPIPESGGFVGLYHSFREDSGTFAVHLATSSDLMSWTWRRQLAAQASMPTIKPASDGGYVVAWEQEPPNHLRLTYYGSWMDLLAGRATKSFDAPMRLSSCAEGTPNLYAASSADVDVGFHFYRDCELDRQARGTTDWRSWTAAARPTLDAALEARGVRGGIGDRDVVRFRGVDLTLIEGQVVNGDWRTWRVFLYDEVTGDARPLEFRTPAGSIAFANPTISSIEIDGRAAILVTLFIPGEGARGAEAGELIYYRTFVSEWYARPLYA